VEKDCSKKLRTYYQITQKWITPSDWGDLPAVGPSPKPEAVNTTSHLDKTIGGDFTTRELQKN